MTTRAAHNCIMPPFILSKLLESDDENVRNAALSTLATSAQLRGRREASGAMRSVAAAPARGRRTIFDAHEREDFLAAELVRGETSAVSTDESVNRAFDGLGTTRKFYQDVLSRDSIDGNGMRLDAYVHYGRLLENAFWDGQRMLFGDGDGVTFQDFTKSLDVIAHELTHGVIQHTADLVYHNQPGALNESIADVFGSLVKQWSRQETADTADWLIGNDIFTPGVFGDALRSMKAPGTAFEDDPQPAHMSDFVNLPDTWSGDWGGVHYNSGIPNRAFYLTSIEVGGYAWEAPGRIWYESLQASTVDTDFQSFAEITSAKAAQLYGTGSAAHSAVKSAWDEVGIRVSGFEPAGFAAAPSSFSFDDMRKHLEELSADIKALTREVKKSNTVRGKEK